MPEKNMRDIRTGVPLLYRPPFCFVPLVGFTVIWSVIMLDDNQMVPMIINVFVGAILGYPMGRLFAWADIACVTVIAAVAREKPWISIAANFMYPVIWDKSYAIRTLVGVALGAVGIFGTILGLYGTYRVFPNAHIPWAQFQGVSFEDVLVNNVNRTVFVYLVVVIGTVTIAEYRWFKSLVK